MLKQISLDQIEEQFENQLNHYVNLVDMVDYDF
jgi:hypothetical protein